MAAIGPGGFRLEVTQLGWWLLGLYGLLWLTLFALSYWAPDWVAVVSVTRMIGPAGYEVSTPSTFPLWELLVLQPVGSASLGGAGFHPVQLITAPLTYPPVGGFSSLMLSCIGYGFFGAPVERLLGRRAFLQTWVVASVGGVLGAILIGVVMPAPMQWGFGPSLLAVMVIACMMTPEATVPFFLVVQVKLRWIAAGIVAIAVVRALGLMGGSVGGGYELAGLACGYYFWRSGGDLNLRRYAKRRRARKTLRLAVDRAISSDDDEADDGPVFH